MFGGGGEKCNCHIIAFPQCFRKSLEKKRLIVGFAHYPNPKSQFVCFVVVWNCVSSSFWIQCKPQSSAWYVGLALVRNATDLALAVRQMQYIKVSAPKACNMHQDKERKKQIDTSAVGWTGTYVPLNGSREIEKRLLPSNGYLDIWSRAQILQP